ncbi:MAG: hypothetical protein HFACDABA_02806 [Anaerolineales bacterium]|nr:hypothetical protein [Anaerolineales bacterium]
MMMILGVCRLEEMSLLHPSIRRLSPFSLFDNGEMSEGQRGRVEVFPFMLVAVSGEG